MRALGLFLIFALGKAAALAGPTRPDSAWTFIACLGQDALAALLFAAVDRIAPKRYSTILFWAITAYAALNIPVLRAVSTPFTAPMLKAAGGPLADSFRLYLTWSNAALILASLGLAFVSSRLRGNTRLALCSLVAFAIAGPLAEAHVDTSGLERNVIEALAASVIPANAPRRISAGWRKSQLATGPVEDLSRLRGLAQGRNIILVSLESTAAQYLKLYGGQDELTPNLTELARHAVVFDHAYAVYPESIKGLYSVLCSNYPRLDADPETYAAAPCHSIPEELRKAGYRTALFHSGRFDYLGMPAVIRNRGYEVLEDAGDIGGNHESSFGVEEPATVARMLAWIDSVPRGERFFLNYLPIAGHHPYQTPGAGPFPDGDDFGRYRNAILYGDAALGDLRAGLRARGLDDNTVWVIYGDHGEAFGQHKGNYAHTFFVYEENVHVPFLIAAPGALPAQSRARKVVSLVDTAPTIAELAGLDRPASYQGVSMLDPEPRMALFFTDYSLRIFGLRDGPWKMIYESGRPPKLFNLDRDPGERNDIAAQSPAQASGYRPVVLGWRP